MKIVFGKTDPHRHRMIPCKKTREKHLSEDFFKAFDSIRRMNMEYILPANDLLKETGIAIKRCLIENESKSPLTRGHADLFDIVAGVLQGDILAPNQFIICRVYVLRTSIDLTKKMALH